MALACLAAGAARADAGAPGVRLDPTVADPLVLARFVRKHGDAVVTRALASKDRAQRLVGVRAAPEMARPASVLVGLCELLGSRDPELAPAAASAALHIAEQIQAEGLESQDMLPGELTPARVALAVAIARPRLRADLVHRAHAIDQVLAESGVPSPPASSE